MLDVFVATGPNVIEDMVAHAYAHATLVLGCLLVCASLATFLWAEFSAYREDAGYEKRAPGSENGRTARTGKTRTAEKP